MNWPSREFELMIHLCTLALFGKNQSQSSMDQINWKELVRLSRMWMVRPTLYLGILKAGNTIEVPEEVLDNLKKQCASIARYNLRHARELILLDELFQKKSISVLPIKGVVLAVEAFGDTGLREFSDLDLLVRPEDIIDLQDVLIERGYENQTELKHRSVQKHLEIYSQFNFNLYQNGQRQIHLEPHSGIGKKRLQAYITLDDFQPFYKKGRLLGRHINVLTPEGYLISTCIHHCTEARISFKYLVDIAAILSKFENQLDWDKVVRHTTQLKILNLILFGIAVTSKVFPVPLPQKIRSLCNSSISTTMVEAELKKMPQPFRDRKNRVIARIMRQLRLRKNWSTRIKLIYYNLMYYLNYRMRKDVERNEKILTG